MKIIDEKGRLFGIINLVDLLVLLIIVAVVAVVGVKLFGTKATELVSVKDVCYAEIEVSGANPRLYNEIQRQMDNLIGARMVSGNEYLDATIEDIWFEPYNLLATNSDGYVVRSVDTTRVNVIFLIKTQVSPDSASLSTGSQDLRNGRSFIVKTQILETSGIIRYVNVGEYTGNGRANAIDLDEFKAAIE